MRIVITGGRSSIAQAIALDRCARGDEVCLTASSAGSLEDLEAQCRQRGIGADCALFELGRPGLASEVFDARLRVADALVLVAATPVRTLDRFHAVPAAEVDEAVEADIKGNLHLLRRALPGMLDRAFGRIVFVSSVSVPMGTSHYGTYCLTKAAVEGLILNLAVDYGSQNVLANIVRLGVFRTGRTGRFWSRTRYAARAAAAIPQGTLGEPGAVAEAVHPLLSPSQYINGSVITVAGGLPLVKASAFRARKDE